MFVTCSGLKKWNIFIKYVLQSMHNNLGRAFEYRINFHFVFQSLPEMSDLYRESLNKVVQGHKIEKSVFSDRYMMKSVISIGNRFK